jgi:SAM-dependent methyltransferase
MDPYTRWGLVKPRGYPGDATLMDFAYGHPSVKAHIANAGAPAAKIYAATSQAKQSQSARERIELLQGELSALSGSRGLKVISVAAGHARELENLPPSVRSKLSCFTAIDTDPYSLKEAEKSAGGIPFKPVRKNAITESFDSIESGDLVYSLGLFDYLTDEHAQVVLEKMLALTASGGKCIIANLAPSAANLGYCEAIMDWWMITRSKEQINALADASIAARGSKFKATVHQVGCFNYLQLVAV